MEDQGIMALPPGQAMQAPTAQPAAPQMDPAAEAAFEQARMQVNPKEFGDSLLSEAMKADPETVQEFMTFLQSINLPPEVIDALGQMVDIILAEPQNYAQIRQELIAAGVPEDLLPPEFDAVYFAAMNMALDQLAAGGAPQPQGFAEGGIVSLNPIASGIAKMGRNGDTMLAHITPSEARLLRSRGGSGTINPATGLPEFFISKALKSIGNAVKGVVKGVGNAVKKFASSTVGRIVATVALGFFLGPAAASMLGVTSAAGVAAVSGFVGGFGSSLLAGQDLRTSLKNGAIGGLVAGAGSAISGGAGAFQSSGMPAPTPGEALSQQWQKFTGGLESLAGKTPLAETGPGAAVDTTQMAQGNVPTTRAPIPESSFRPIEYPTGQGPMASAADNIQLASMGPRTVTDVTAGITGPSQVADVMPADVASGRFADQAIRQAGFEYNPSGGPLLRATEYIDSSTVVPGYEGGVPPKTTFTDTVKGYGQRIADFYKASPGAEDLNAEAIKRGYPNYAAAPEKVQMAIEKAAAPTFGTTSRMIGTGLLGLSALGGFKQEPAKRPNIIPTETGYDLLRRNPEIYGVTPGGGYVTYGVPYFVTPPRFAMGGIAALAPSRYALGGYAGGGTSRFPRRTGSINGPGTGTSDSIPAMLSDGEFVMTARAVRGAGKGSRREGAKKMYAMMKALERKANG